MRGLVISDLVSREYRQITRSEVLAQGLGTRELGIGRRRDLGGGRRRYPRYEVFGIFRADGCISFRFYRCFYYFVYSLALPTSLRLGS
jgi:hypothetical protein